MIAIIALHIIKQTVQNYCIQFELLLTKSLTEILSEHARGTSVFHEVLNWQNSNMSSLLQILSRWNHKCSVLHWAPMLQSKSWVFWPLFEGLYFSQWSFIFTMKTLIESKAGKGRFQNTLWFICICFSPEHSTRGDSNWALLHTPEPKSRGVNSAS